MGNCWYCVEIAAYCTASETLNGNTFASQYMTTPTSTSTAAISGTIALSCLNGYTANGTMTATCEADTETTGVWTTGASCFGVHSRRTHGCFPSTPDLISHLPYIYCVLCRACQTLSSSSHRD